MFHLQIASKIIMLQKMENVCLMRQNSKSVQVRHHHNGAKEQLYEVRTMTRCLRHKRIRDFSLAVWWLGDLDWNC